MINFQDNPVAMHVKFPSKMAKNCCHSDRKFNFFCCNLCIIIICTVWVWVEACCYELFSKNFRWQSWRKLFQYIKNGFTLLEFSLAQLVSVTDAYLVIPPHLATSSYYKDHWKIQAILSYNCLNNLLSNICIPGKATRQLGQLHIRSYGWLPWSVAVI